MSGSTAATSAKGKAKSAAASSSSSATRALRFTGHIAFRQRLVLAVLAGKPIRIDRIRPDDEQPGLRDFEAGFLRLLEKCTNGTHVEIGYTGTSLLLRPGIVAGGKITHDCGTARPIGYYLEWIALLAPFAKKEFNLTLKGITNGHTDLGVDILRTVTLPHLSMFLPPSTSTLASALELRLVRRGAPPLGGGEVFFRCPLLPSSGGGEAGGMLRTINFVEPGRIRRIRGIASAMRVSPQMANRMIDVARSVLNRYIPDLFLFSDVFKGDESGKSPGYCISLVSTSTTGALHCAECISQPGAVPEDIALKASRSLLAEISTRGCIDRAHQSHVLALMALGPQDVGKVRIGALTPQSVQMMRDIQEALGVTFKVTEADQISSGPFAKPRLPKTTVTRNLSDEDEDEDEDDYAGFDDEDEDDEQDGAATGSPELLISCLGIGVRGYRKVG
ncbi:hypothetical protein OC846_000001 [Tilletia horrida]|uniref:18S rRNA biogenesis protein RCL1 n=1 Tax=Tilletia horrida TaxID=155126 RepID=A0AAN6GVR7_9BASI|nr:hypothetical protein OC846_000001 [Tilletia horrida]KAK0569145.1 hypothetical protein OC861_001181 [Tilletia horrida]